MKNILKNTAIAMLCGMSLTSCEGFFNQIVTLDIPPQKSVIVVNCLLDTEIPFNIGISNSIPALGTTNPTKSLKNAQITLKADGVEITDIFLDSTLNTNPVGSQEYDYFYRTLNTKPSAGKTYTINVSVPGFEPVNATYTMPAPVVITNVVVERNARTVNNIDYTRISFVIQDVAAQKNYYALKVDTKAIDTVTNQELGRYFYDYFTRDLSVRENYQTDPIGGTDETVLGIRYYNAALFTDSKFDGKNKTIEFFMETESFDRNNTGSGIPTEQKVVELVVDGYSIESYRYILQIEKQAQVSGSPFADPVQITTNINGGLGIFAGKSKYKIRIN